MSPTPRPSEERHGVQGAREYLNAVVQQPDPFSLEYSVLFLKADAQEEPSGEPAYFGDLNLDLVVDAITADYAAYDLKPFYYRCLHDLPSIVYRQEVMRDLEAPETAEAIKLFAKAMGDVRKALAFAASLRNHQHIQAWKAKAIETYCRGTQALSRDLARCSLKSAGLKTFLEHLKAYVDSADFLALAKDVGEAIKALMSVGYAVIIKGDTFTVRKAGAEPDLSTEVLKTFAKFKESAGKDYRVEFPESAGMNHIEEKILEFVTALHPEAFTALDRFHQIHARFLHPAIIRFDREIEFFLSYLHFIDRFRRAGLSLCYPEVSESSKAIRVDETYDVALARRLVDEDVEVVVNDLKLQGRERIFVVTGPNQGGKTTFARTFGQLHHFGCLGCKVPGREAHLYLFRSIFTHFERAESIQSLRGKLEEDLTRIHSILMEATARDIVLFNEIFTSTTIQDALFLSEKVMHALIAKDVLGVWVTFIDELTTLSDAVVSAVSTVEPHDLTRRTFKVIRRPADGLAYAISIAEKYRVTYEALMERIQR